MNALDIDADGRAAWAQTGISAGDYTSVAEALSGGARTPAYVAFIGDEGEEGVRRAYPAATLKRLAQVKRRYDPDNLYHLNVNVTPDMKEASAPQHERQTPSGGSND